VDRPVSGSPADFADDGTQPDIAATAATATTPVMSLVVRTTSFLPAGSCFQCDARAKRFVGCGAPPEAGVRRTDVSADFGLDATVVPSTMTDVGNFPPCPNGRDGAVCASGARRADSIG